jgi:hypothetical protein
MGKIELEISSLKELKFGRGDKAITYTYCGPSKPAQ